MAVMVLILREVPAGKGSFRKNLPGIGGSGREPERVYQCRDHEAGGCAGCVAGDY